MSKSDDVDMTSSGSDDGNYTASAKPVPVTRKPTYILRKEEKQSLQTEIEQLHATLQTLEDSNRQRTQEKYKALEEAGNKRAQVELQMQFQNVQLRSAVQQQHLSFAVTQSAVTSYVSTQNALPYETKIYLGSDFSERRETLIKAKEGTLKAALAYSTARTQFLDPFQSYSESTRYQLSSGEWCSVQLDQTPLFLPNLTARQVFNAIVANRGSIDVRITDEFDDITTADDIDYGIPGIRQNRLTSRLACGVDTEMNAINFYDFFEQVDGALGSSPVGVFTGDSVERDDLCPYRTSERVRHDLNGVIVVREHSRKQYDPVIRSEVEESVIVVSHCSLFKIHCPQMALPMHVELQLRDQLGQWASAMVSGVVEQINSLSGSNLS